MSSRQVVEQRVSHQRGGAKPLGGPSGVVGYLNDLGVWLWCFIGGQGRLPETALKGECRNPQVTNASVRRSVKKLLPMCASACGPERVGFKQTRANQEYTIIAVSSALPLGPSNQQCTDNTYDACQVASMRDLTCRRLRRPSATSVRRMPKQPCRRANNGRMDHPTQNA